MAETGEQMVARLRREHGLQAGEISQRYVETLERELRERLAVNVGLLRENAALKEAKR